MKLLKKKAKEIKEKNFREDLYHRLNVCPIHLPTLADRKEDIPLLTRHFIDHYNRLQKRDIKGIASDALSLLLSHDFPGNIRELEHSIEYAVVLCREAVIEINHIPQDLRDSLSLTTVHPPPESRPFKEAESQVIVAAMKKHHGNRMKAAQELGIDRSTLWRKIKKLHIDF